MKADHLPVHAPSGIAVLAISLLLAGILLPRPVVGQPADADSLAGVRAAAFPLLAEIPARDRNRIPAEEGALTGIATLSATGVFHALLAVESRRESGFHAQVLFIFRSRQKGDLFQLRSPAYSPDGQSLLRIELRDTLPLEVVYFTDTIIAVTRLLPAGEVGGTRSVVDQKLRSTFREQLAAAGLTEEQLRAGMQRYNTPFRYNVLPAPSETYRMDRFFEGLNLLEAGNKLSAALADESCGYLEQGFYDFPYGRGFVLATRLEQIDPDDARPKQPGRWSTKVDPLNDGFSLTSYLKALFFADNGHFRLLLFVFSDQPLLFDETKKRSISREEGAGLVRNGDPQLSAAYDDLQFDDGYHCTALIYEFEQSEFTHAVKLVEKSPHSGAVHLQSAGILSKLGN